MNAVQLISVKNGQTQYKDSSQKKTTTIMGGGRERDSVDLSRNQ